jgi:general secretion pathway protein B
MSYILDALKKAERERDIRQVPTLMAEHEAGTTRRKLTWAVLGVLAICAGTVIGLTIFLQRTPDTPAPSPTAGSYGTGAQEPGMARTGATGSPAMPAATTESPGARSAGSIPAAPGAIVPGVPRDFSAAKTLDSARLQQTTEWMAAAAQRDAADAGDVPSPEMMGRQPSRMPVPGRATKADAPAAVEPKEKPASLKEALNEMTLSVLVYDESKADRMVFINGRKYAEGDYVEDMYFLESITLDGAVLTYQGERALLRPKAK